MIILFRVKSKIRCKISGSYWKLANINKWAAFQILLINFNIICSSICVLIPYFQMYNSYCNVCIDFITLFVRWLIFGEWEWVSDEWTSDWLFSQLLIVYNIQTPWQVLHQFGGCGGGGSIATGACIDLVIRRYLIRSAPMMT